MKLTHFNLETLPKNSNRSAAAKVSFGKAGTIHFNHNACELMKIKAGDKITFSQNAESPEDWYFFLDKVNGYEMRSGYDKKGCLFNHAELIRKFNEALELDDNKTRQFLICQTPATNGGGG